MDRFVTRKPSAGSALASEFTAATTREQKDKILLDLLSCNNNATSKSNSSDDWAKYNGSSYTLEDVDKITKEKTKPKPFKAGNSINS